MMWLLWESNGFPRTAQLDLVPILDPAKFTFAGYHEAGYDIDTDRLMQDFIRQIRGNGGTIVTKAEVTAIIRQTDGWQVVAGGQTYGAAKLVNAAGAWADEVAQAAGIAPIGITPRRRSHGPYSSARRP